MAAGRSPPTSAASTTRGRATGTPASPTPTVTTRAPTTRGSGASTSALGALRPAPLVSPNCRDPLSRPRRGRGCQAQVQPLARGPDGSRFAFLHRWLLPGKPTATRLITADADGTRLYVLDPYGKTSHYDWRDPQHILAWACSSLAGGEVLPVRGPDYKGRGGRSDVMTQNGHCTYLPDRRWILNDTYPDRDRNQHPYLYDVAHGTRHPLGHFRSPPEYAGEWRCDAHPGSALTAAAWSSTHRTAATAGNCT